METIEGIRLQGADGHRGSRLRGRLHTWLEELGLAASIHCGPRSGDPGGTLRLCFAGQLPGGHDTLGLSKQYGWQIFTDDADLQREILVTLSMAPQCLDFPSLEELESAVRMRCNIVRAAQATTLAFDTEAAERPEAFWRYGEASGFILKPGRSLVDALRATTQVPPGGRLYSFSCYRATEYVILLALAQELERCNPALYERLEEQWRRRAMVSAEFHQAFLEEIGTLSRPLPVRYMVPGDRLWFRNPDAHSSNAEGYEGSWVFYLGAGLYTNFWKRDQPYTLTGKCVELYHWRNATWRDARGRLRVDDDRVDELVGRSLADPAELARILGLMQRLRDPAGVHAGGGCLDATREALRPVRPGTAAIALPAC